MCDYGGNVIPVIVILQYWAVETPKPSELTKVKDLSHITNGPTETLDGSAPTATAYSGTWSYNPEPKVLQYLSFFCCNLFYFTH